MCGAPLGQVKHDYPLRLSPADHNLSVAQTNHRVPLQAQERIVLVVSVALFSLVLAPIDLEYEPIVDEKVDPVAGDPGLGCDSTTQRPKPTQHKAFKAGVREFRALS